MVKFRANHQESLELKRCNNDIDPRCNECSPVANCQHEWHEQKTIDTKRCVTSNAWFLITMKVCNSNILTNACDRESPLQYKIMNLVLTYSECYVAQLLMFNCENWKMAVDISDWMLKKQLIKWMNCLRTDGIASLKDWRNANLHDIISSISEVWTSQRRAIHLN
jgi:hypothetical protein